MGRKRDVASVEEKRGRVGWGGHGEMAKWMEVMEPRLEALSGGRDEGPVQ